MQSSFVIYESSTGNPISTVKGPSEVVAMFNPSQPSFAALLNSALADMICGYIVACEIYDFRDGITAIGLVTPRMDSVEYMKPLNSVTLGIYQDSVKCVYRAPSEQAVRLTMALLELEDATKH